MRFDRDGRGVATSTVNVLPGPGGSGRFRLGYVQPQARPGAGERDPRRHGADGGVQGEAGGRARRGPRHERRCARPGGVAAAVAAERAALRGAAERRLRRSDRPGGDRLPQAHGIGARAADTDARVFHLLRRRRGRLPRALPEGRQARGGRSRRAGARRDRTGRARAAHLHDQLGQALDPHGRWAASGSTSRRPGSTRRGWWTPTTSSAATRSTGTPKCPRYAASHGCLRVPIPDAPAIYAWVRVGTPVDVYY